MFRIRIFSIFFEIDFGFLTFCLVCQYFFSLNQMVCFVFACLVHEMGHLFAFVMLGEKIEKIKLSCTGMIIVPKFYLKSFVSDIIILSFGALFNFIFGIIALILVKKYQIGIFCIITGAFHLICLPCLDGGRIFYIFMQRFFDEDKAFKIYQVVVLCVVIILILFNFISRINNVFVYFLAVVSLIECRKKDF